MKTSANRIIAVILLLAALGLIVVLTRAFQSDVREQQGVQRPTVVPAHALTPAPTPADNREIAVLNLVITAAEDGRVEAIQLERGRILRSYAPNVLGRPGAWTVELVGAEIVSFGIQDPREVHVLEEDENSPHSTALLAGEIAWELVVPLFDKDKDLQVQEINIYDENGEIVFSTLVDRQRWQRR